MAETFIAQQSGDLQRDSDRSSRRERNARTQTEATPKWALSLDEFCRIFGIGRTLAYRQIRLKRLRVKKIGRRTLIARDEAERWFQSL